MDRKKRLQSPPLFCGGGGGGGESGNYAIQSNQTLKDDFINIMS